MLPIRDGLQLPATERLVSIVSEYSQILLDNEPSLKVRFKREEFFLVAQRAFGQVFDKIKLDQPTNGARPDTKSLIESKIREAIENNRKKLEMVLGCDLFTTLKGYPITVGPITFQTREQWCKRALESGEVSSTTSRRLQRVWSGKRIKMRKPSQESMKETSIIESIGEKPIVCTIKCDGLSPKMIEEKSLLTARLGICAMSLMWRRPSHGLRKMNLNYDGPLHHRAYVLFGEGGLFSASHSISQLPGGVRADHEFLEQVQEYAGIFDVLGDVLTSYVQPNHPSTRPVVINAIFLSLLWFYEACTASSDQIATTKYAASLDALSGGNGQSGIEKLIEARIGHKPTDKLMGDGRTTREVVSEIYKVGRSQLIHGSSQDFAFDWSGLRLTAEAVSRLCFVEIISWLAENSDVTSIEQIMEH